MGVGSIRAGLVLVMVLLVSSVGWAQAETVTLPGAAVALSAELFKPEGTGPFPAVVALHGCGGLRSKSGEMTARHAAWGQHLARQGFVVLMPDSFGSRGLKSQCRVKDRSVRASRDRVGDADAARAFLTARADVKAGAVSIMGWSNGASTVLHVVADDRAAGAEHVGVDFAAAVAFYPGCASFVRRGTWQPRLPVLLLIGASDDWTPAEPCVALGAKVAAGRPAMAVVTYPGAYHDFDHPGLPLRRLSGLATPANGLAHAGTDVAARADAIERVTAFLPR